MTHLNLKERKEKLAKDIAELKNKEHMSEEQKSLIRAFLVDHCGYLQNDIKRDREEYASIELNTSDPVDKADATRTQEEMQSKIARTDNEIKATKRAIHSIDEDEYGYCQDGGIEIGLERLLTNPSYVTRDLDCETLHEKKRARELGIRV